MNRPTSRLSSVPPPGPADFRGLPVLVTGASGFIGRHLTRRLETLGAVVHATTRHTIDDRPLPGVDWHTCDLTDPAAVDEVVQRVRPAAVFHLASQVEGRRAPELVLPMMDANTRAAVALMSAVQDVPGCRIVLAGSVEEPRDEEAPCSPYAAAKHAATGYAQLFHSQWGLPVTVLRIAMVYGPDQPDTAKLVPYCIESFLRGDLPAVGSGTREIDWVYVDDVVEAFVRAALSPGAPGLVADIGTGRAHTIAEVVTTIAALTGHDGPVPLGQRADRANDVVHVAEILRARKALGWHSTTPLDVGLAGTVNWHRRRRALLSATG